MRRLALLPLLAGCLSVLPPPDSTGVHRDVFGGRCVDSECPGPYACDVDFAECATSCWKSTDCKEGYDCDDEYECAPVCRPGDCTPYACDRDHPADCVEDCDDDLDCDDGYRCCDVDRYLADRCGDMGACY